jgi:hypothetical protein
MSHATVTNLDKVVEVMMADLSTPPRKYTTLRHKYIDLRTPKDLEVFHAVIPRVEAATRGASVDCLYLAGNHMAKDMAAKNCSMPICVVVAPIPISRIQREDGAKSYG